MMAIISSEHDMWVWTFIFILLVVIKKGMGMDNNANWRLQQQFMIYRM